MSTDMSFTHVFASALRGAPTTVVWLDQEPTALPVDVWSRSADHLDHQLVALCDGPTIDIGCGPGRLTEALTAAGHLALGIDVVEAAVEMTRERGVPALCRDVFDEVPDEGRWQTALLADGNIGIGGDPVVLLRRVRSVLDPRGSIVAEVAGPGVPSAQGWASLEGSVHRSRPFRWAVVGLDDLPSVAAEAGLAVRSAHALGDRWAVVLTREGR